MARYSMILLGPARQNDPQVREGRAFGALMPGSALTYADGGFSPAAVNTDKQIFLCQENYLRLQGVSAPWPVNDTAIGLLLMPDAIYAALLLKDEEVEPGVPLTLGLGGRFKVAGEGDRTFAFADEFYHNDTGADQLIRIRVSGTPGPVGPQGPEGP